MVQNLITNLHTSKSTCTAAHVHKITSFYLFIAMHVLLRGGSASEACVFNLQNHTKYAVGSFTTLAGYIIIIVIVNVLIVVVIFIIFGGGVLLL